MIAPLFSVESWVTQYFGFTKFAKTRYKSEYHNGLDLRPVDRESWDIFAPIVGRVEEIGNDNTYGKYVELWNRYKGIRLVFWHLDEVKVRPADILQVGDLIGTGGNSGSNTTGRHLHLGYMPMKAWGKPDHAGNGTQGWVDPLGLLVSLGVNI